MTEPDKPIPTHTPLSRCGKNLFPFRLATTSFIYPDHLAPNVRMLGPFVDEVELLFFESSPPDSLPRPAEIRELVKLAAEHHISYNIHLPLDLSLTARSPARRDAAIETLKTIFDLAAPLAPSTWTPHIPAEDAADNFNDWHDRAAQSLSRLCPCYIAGADLSVETLSYPLEWIADIIAALDLSICLDIGHMSVYGMDWEAFYQKYAEKIPIIHLYGFETTHSHLGLDRLPLDIRRSIAAILKNFTGTVCLEVFSYDHLEASLKILPSMI